MKKTKIDKKMKAKGSELISILTRAGSDCSGGAGEQADLKIK